MAGSPFLKSNRFLPNEERRGEKRNREENEGRKEDSVDLFSPLVACLISKVYFSDDNLFESLIQSLSSKRKFD